MDVFRFMNPSFDTLMEQGQIINGLKSKMWVERYLTAGEFKFVADTNTGMQKQLPVGCFVSHVDSPEIMVVENHEISEAKDKNSEIVITGRSYETILEQRMIGMNGVWPNVGNFDVYLLPDDYANNQLNTLFREHFYAVGTPTTFYHDDVIPYLLNAWNTGGSSFPGYQRLVKFGPVYDRVMELLKVYNWGMKIIRPGPYNIYGLAGGDPAYAQYATLLVYSGVDRSSTVSFSQDTGEIETADYLWSNKNVKNTIFMIGKWVHVRVDLGPVGINRRMMLVDASDLDKQYDTMPSVGGTDYLAIVASMEKKGREILAAQVDVNLTKAEVAKNFVKAQYRKDFDIGDIVTINGNYNTTSKMRVTEHVEIEDETGQTSYPTLSAV